MKNNTIIFSVIALLCFGKLQAQDWSGTTYKYGGKYPGYIIKLNGDTIKGYIEHNGRTDNQNKAVFYSDLKDRKTKIVYKPEDIEGYMVGDKFYRAIHYSGGLLAKPMRFNLLLKDGHISQYTFYTKEEGYVIQVRTNGETDAQYDKRVCKEQIVFQKGDEQAFQDGEPGFILKFAKKMSELVSDYPELSKKIAAKEKGYGLAKRFDIIDEYNTWYAEQHGSNL